MAILNMTQAAKAAGIGRSTLYRHAKKGTISTVVLPDGSPGVDSAELFRVFSMAQPAQPANITGTVKVAHDETVDTVLLKQQICHLQELLAVERRNSDDLRLALKAIELKRPALGFFSRFFGGKN